MELTELRKRHAALGDRAKALAARQAAHREAGATAAASGEELPPNWGKESQAIVNESELVTLGLSTLAVTINDEENKCRIAIAKLKHNRKDPAVRRQNELTTQLEQLTATILNNAKTGGKEPSQDEYWKSRAVIKQELAAIDRELSEIAAEVDGIDLSTEEKFNLFHGR